MASQSALPERAGYPAPPDLQVRRDGMAGALASGALPAPEGQATEIVGDIRTIRFGSSDCADTVIVHFHGGGFRLGAPEVCAGYAAKLSSGGNATVYCPAYRLSPEAPFPAALNDAMQVVRRLASRGSRLIVAGDSAGGGLAASLMQLCARDGIPIAGLVLHSPWLDLSVSSASYQNNASADPLFSKNAATEAAQMYLQGHPATDPLASPLLADLTDFPPTFISVGEEEVLLDDARALHGRLVEASQSATLLEVAGMDHVAVTRGSDVPGSPEVLAATLSFLAALD
ncbi:alpha/beta hydrolase [Novosphingobium sp. RD2P27]|uniref:Alpha/beta hydrolase n=1 Tax=Novosphingobium kalidii TaxID=3230299 RepID=A0ABV2D206_9SPHN